MGRYADGFTTAGLKKFGGEAFNVPRSEQEYEVYQRAVGGITWERIRYVFGDELPTSKGDLKNAVYRADASKNPSDKTTAHLTKWIWDAKQPEITKARELKTSKQPRPDAPKTHPGLRFFKNRKGVLSVRGKGWKRALSVLEYQQRINAARWRQGKQPLQLAGGGAK